MGLEQETAIFTGFDGEAEWGLGFDPKTGLLYVNSNDVAWTAKLRENQELASAQPPPLKPRYRFAGFTNGSTTTAIRRLRLHGEP